MFRRILVAVDEPASAPHALHAAERLAARPGAQIVVAHVAPAAADVTTSEGEIRLLASELRERGMDAKALVEYDRPEDGLARIAEREHADLVVLTPHGRHGLGALRHPSVTQRMLSRCPAPLLIWPEGPGIDLVRGFLRGPCSLVVVPLDGSESAERALPFAVAFAREHHRSLLLLRVAQATHLLGSGPGGYTLTGETLKAEVGEARSYLTALREQLEWETGVHAEGMLRLGNPAEEIAHTVEAHPGSLVVMSTHGRGGLARSLVGSVAGELIRRAPVPVLVTPPGAVPPEMDAAAHTTEADAGRGAIAGDV